MSDAVVAPVACRCADGQPGADAVRPPVIFSGRRPAYRSWVSMVTEHFRTNVNGGPWASAQDIADIGSYNILIGDSAFYRTGQESFEESHHVFHQAFPGGFYWEVLDVLSPPPVVAFKWRHWRAFEGEYNGFAPNGETIEMFGMSVAKVSDDLKLIEVEHYYDPNGFLGKLTGGCPVQH